MPVQNTVNLLDPQLGALLREFEDNGAPELYKMDPVLARDAYAKGIEALGGPVSAVGRCVDERIDTDEATLPVRVYFPINQGSSVPLVVYFHGGGWSFGSIETHDRVCRSICAGADCIVASVDYRLAPEHKFPAAVDDAIAAVRWAWANAERLGANRDKFIVAGDSAGANLATVAALALRHQKRVRISCQLLIYPATDMSMEAQSHKEFGAGYRLTRPLMVWSSTNYLRDGRDILDPRASPLLAEDHSELPQALIITAGFDPLRDEGAAYAEKLAQCGVRVRYRCFESLIHGFAGLTGVVDAAKTAIDEIATMLKESC